MTTQEHLLSCLAEECAEISEQCAALAVRVSKALRFGLNEQQSGDLRTNAERIAIEIGDLLGVAEILVEAGVIHREVVVAKKLKVVNFLAYAKEIGSVVDIERSIVFKHIREGESIGRNSEYEIFPWEKGWVNIGVAAEDLPVGSRVVRDSLTGKFVMAFGL